MSILEERQVEHPEWDLTESFNELIADKDSLYIIQNDCGSIDSGSQFASVSLGIPDGDDILVVGKTAQGWLNVGNIQDHGQFDSMQPQDAVQFVNELDAD